MKDNFLLHFSVLVFGIIIAAFFFVYFRFEPTMQVAVAALGCMYYIGWGIVHHAIRERLTRLIAFEYVLMGCFIFLLLLGSTTL